jgi:heme-degrading monooxygenase HmoA
MIERHVTFDVHPDKTRDFETFFTREYRPAMAKMPGYVKVELLRAEEIPTAYQMVIRFESAEAAAAWRLSETHQALSPRLKALYSSSQVQVYEVVA